MVQGFGTVELFKMPTVAQMRWQLWSAVNEEGVIVFAHGAATIPYQLVDWQRETEVLTPQGEAVKQAFADLRPVTKRSTLTWDGAALLIADPNATTLRTLKVWVPVGLKVESAAQWPWPLNLLLPSHLSLTLSPGEGRFVKIL